MNAEMEHQHVELVCDALEEVVPPFLALLRSVTNRDVPAVGTWSIGDTARHCSETPAYFLAATRGERGRLLRVGALDAGNEGDLDADSERDPSILSARFSERMRALVATARSTPGNPTVQAFVDAEMPLSELLGLSLGELLVHGRDIAKAAALDWRISARHALLAHRAYAPLVPVSVDQRMIAEMRMRIDLRVRGGNRWLIAVDRGDVQVHDQVRGPVDCHVSVEPVSYLLLLFGRVSPWPAMALGRLVVWGRRPAAVATLASAIRT